MTAPTPLRRVLVANRGEIAVRIVRACHAETIEAVVATSDADIDSLAARLADDAVEIGPAPATESYLRVEQIVAAALLTGCDAIHPGYGFLSERPDLAEACATHGLAFVGPSAGTIRRGGDKVAARALARAAGVPIAAGSVAVSDPVDARAIADGIGYPVLLKAAAGGGGRGMVRAGDGDELDRRFPVASREAEAAFGDGRLYIERFVERARHVEIQLLGDCHGNLVHLGDRDCSIQRRFQKVVEEAPAATVSSDLRERIADAAVALGRHLGYVGAGTVEFLVDLDREEFAFLEVNTRLQVEHPVTEVVTGIDIVRTQLRIAAGEPLPFSQDEIEIAGHAIEHRINAESPADDFRPSPGVIATWSPPSGDHIRLDTHASAGTAIAPHYDSLIAKLVVGGTDRGAALDRAARALDEFEIGGIDTTVDLHRAIVADPDMRAGRITTRWLETNLLPGIAAIT